MDNFEEDEILSPEEQQKIADLRKNPSIFEIVQKAKLAHEQLFAMAALSNPVADFKFDRRIGLNPVVKVNNISGKKAWIILTPAPIMSISSVGIDKLGEISFTPFNISNADFYIEQII